MFLKGTASLQRVIVLRHSTITVDDEERPFFAGKVIIDSTVPEGAIVDCELLIDAYQILAALPPGSVVNEADIYPESFRDAPEA